MGDNMTALSRLVSELPAGHQEKAVGYVCGFAGMVSRLVTDEELDALIAGFEDDADSPFEGDLSHLNVQVWKTLNMLLAESGRRVDEREQLLDTAVAQEE